MMTDRPTVSRFICRVCGGSGTLVSLAPAQGYACAGCMAKHGKAALIEASMAKEAEREYGEKRRDRVGCLGIWI